jgi:hypothetical protein
VFGWPAAFRGSAAVHAGLLAQRDLRGPRFRRVHPDVYVRAADEFGPELVALAAAALVEGRGVVSGYSAATLLGADCTPSGAPAEITLTGGADGRGGIRAHPGLVVHSDATAPREVTQVADALVTTALRTAYDIARWITDLTEAVVATDALARVGPFAPEQVLELSERYPRARGRARLPRVVALADPRSGSPMQSRLRLLLVLGGLPAPEVRPAVPDPAGGAAVRLDLAYPEQRIGIEYSDLGRADRVLRDAGRLVSLVDDGWRIVRVTRHDLWVPERVVDTVRHALAMAR